MVSWKKYLSETFQDVDGSYSFKRVATFICIVLIVIGFTANLFFGFKIEEFIFDAISYIVMAGLGIVGAEKFAPKKKDGEE